jgi:hypothetical protein
MSGTRTRLILILFQILNPVEPRSSSMGLKPSSLSFRMVALVPAAPTASFLKKLSSLLKLFATDWPRWFSESPFLQIKNTKHISRYSMLDWIKNQT